MARIAGPGMCPAGTLVSPDLSPAGLISRTAPSSSFMRLFTFLTASPPDVRLLALACLAAALPLRGTEADSIAAARDTYKEYIAIRKLIGDETASWRTEQASLVDMIAVLKTRE